VSSNLSYSEETDSRRKYVSLYALESKRFNSELHFITAFKLVAEAPWLLDGIFPRKKNDVDSRVPSDIIPTDIRDEPKRAIKADIQEAAVEDEKIETDEPSKLLEDIIKAKPIEKQIIAQEVKIVEEPIIIPTEKITDRNDRKIDLAKEKELIQEITIIQKPTVTPAEKITDRDDKEIDLIEEKEVPVEELDQAAPAEIDLEPSVEAEEYCN